MQRIIYIKGIVIELYVIKNWWKIKFNNKAKNSSALFFPLNVNNINKLDFVVTEFLFINEQ